MLVHEYKKYKDGTASMNFEPHGMGALITILVKVDPEPWGREAS